MLKIKKKILTLIIGFCIYTAYGGVIYECMPSEITIIEGEDISLRNFSPQPSSALEAGVTSSNTSAFKSEIKLCGIIPIKTVNVKKISAEEVVPSGNLIGIALYTKGVVVISTDSFIYDGKIYAPSLRSGIKPGDIITEINGEKINSSYELSEKILGGKVTLKILRQGKYEEIEVSPQKNEDTGDYKLGVWVRDSFAGIGTLTFYNPQTKKYAALGHGLTDADTNMVYSPSGGELKPASVISVNKGKKGVPGELCGVIDKKSGSIGSLFKNCESGISGTLTNTGFLPEETAVLGPRSEVTAGSAYILCCISGNDVQKYNVEIERVCNGSENSSKDMVIHITDKKLLEKTGGIVQGMSGSPIIQNGKLIGAVTHVFVNDPTRGYGIFIDKMFKNTLY